MSAIVVPWLVTIFLAFMAGFWSGQLSELNRKDREP